MTMNWPDDFSRLWPHLAGVFHLVAAVFTSVHALLHKRDSRAAALWVGIIWLVPLVGPLLYLTLGINRIRRRALPPGSPAGFAPAIPAGLGASGPGSAGHLARLAGSINRVVRQPLTTGNRLQSHVNGDEAFPAMLAAIESAQVSVGLITYIFDNDPVGRRFVDALGRAVRRGVAVRVLIDAAGARYSWPPVTRELNRAGVPFARFLPSSLMAPWRVATLNLRNHRKALLLDGRIAFTGGMNIRQGNVLADRPRHPVQDLHFQLEGAVVAQLQSVFADDWNFTTGEVLQGPAWFPELCGHGQAVARAITDGPDDSFDELRWTLLAALAEAQTSVLILTPYFLPDLALIMALNLAVVRGVRVDIIVPEKGNLPFVDWASRGMWWQVLERGCHLWLTPPPFDHSKLMVVDGHWVLLGSANWDPRSLRLNFELNVECYGTGFAAEAEAIIRHKLASAREVGLAEADGRSLPARLRDATARLWSPFL